MKSGTVEDYITASNSHEAAIKALRQMLPSDRLGFLMAVFPLKSDGYTVDEDLSKCHAFVTECLAKDIGIPMREVV